MRLVFRNGFFFLTLPETRRLWRSIVTDFTIDDEPGRLLLAPNSIRARLR